MSKLSDIFQISNIKLLFPLLILYGVLLHQVSFTTASIQNRIDNYVTGIQETSILQVFGDVIQQTIPLHIPYNCTEETDFPEDIFTDEQRLQGALILHFIGGLYGFTLLAVICNDYFIPSVECICEDLNLSPDVAAATFMAVATSSPELAINMISTFFTESKLGIGTIVGSSMFNTLGVGAIGGLAASAPIAIKKWPIMRDTLIYCCTVAILVSMTWDNRIEWYESTILVSLYFLYFIFMFNIKRITRGIKSCFKIKEKNKKDNTEEEEEEEEDRYTARVSIILRRSTRSRKSIKSKQSDIEDGDKIEKLDDNEGGVKKHKSLWSFPREKTFIKKAWYVYTWPLKLILTCLIPSPKTYRKLYPLSFFMCIVCIGGNSYIVSWMITIIGDTLKIPESIMGMTFLAFGGCLPEACSIFIMSRRGEGGMGVSNALGANTLNILFSLGTPWFIKSMVLMSEGEDGHIEMEGMDLIILSLILAAIVLVSVLAIGGFEMKKTVGATILVLYFVFIIFAILMESGVFSNNENETRKNC